MIFLFYPIAMLNFIVIIINGVSFFVFFKN